MAKKITERSIRNLTWDDVNSMGRRETQEYLKIARQVYSKKASMFERNSNVYSAAYESMKKWTESDESTMGTPVSRINKNPGHRELYRISNFLQRESSTLKGARKIAKEQDIRIFGVKSNGNPTKRMTRTQREAFWALYDEYLNTYKTADTIYRSGKIQQFLGDMVRSTKGGILDVSADNIQRLDNLLKANPFKRISDRADSYANVLSGKWNFNEE